MATRELSNKLASGEITSIKIGGTDSGNLVQTSEQVDAKIADSEAALTYDYVKVESQIVNTDVFTDVGSLVTPTRAAGLYEDKFSMTFSYDNVTRSADFRFSIDGGVTWNEFAREPKDTTDKYHMFYAFPAVHVEEPINFIVQAKCESAADTLTIHFLDIVAERKK